MARYIDADELIKLVEEKDKEMWGDLCLGNVTDAIEQTQTVDVQEVKHGHWFKPSVMSQNVCSNCRKSPHMLFGMLPDYCPWCGADMVDDK